MTDRWLEIADDELDAQEVMRVIRTRIAARGGSAPGDADPVALARVLHEEMIGTSVDDSAAGRLAALGPEDCDIVPRRYTIDWRTPILGPLHAALRRIINAEVRRYLVPSLEKQSSLNRSLVRLVVELVQENERLSQRVRELDGREE